MFLHAGIPSFRHFLVLVHLVTVHMFFFSSLQAKGADDGAQMVFSLFGQLWAFLTFQRFGSYLLIITLHNVILLIKCHPHLPNKDLYYIILSAAFSIIYWPQPHLGVYRFSYINCH